MFQPVLKFWEQLKTDVKVTFNSNRAKNPSLKKPSKNFNWGFNEKKPNPISKIEASSINKEAQAFEKTESENSSSTSKAEKGSGGSNISPPVSQSSEESSNDFESGQSGLTKPDEKFSGLIENKKMKR